MAFAIQNPSTQLGAAYVPPAMPLPIPDEKTVYEGLVGLLQRMPEAARAKVTESLATRLADDAGMSIFGRGVTDSIHPEQHVHASLEVNPYSHVGAGATVAVTATDPRSGEIFVLMARKWKDPNNHALGLGDAILPGGYIDAHPLEHGAPKSHPDNSLEDTARRELREETGIVLPQEVPLTSLGADSRYGISNDPRLHTINEFFHANLMLPPPPRMLPELTAGDDVAVATWVNAKQIMKDDSLHAQPFGSEKSRYHLLTNDGPVNIRDEHGEYLEKALQQAQARIQSQPMKQWVDRLSPPGSSITITR